MALELPTTPGSPVRTGGSVTGRVLQNVARKIADQIGWPDTFTAEYIALTQLTFGSAPVALLGNSFGCQGAVEGALRRPDLVAALILVGPTIDPAAVAVWVSRCGAGPIVITWSASDAPVRVSQSSKIDGPS